MTTRTLRPADFLLARIAEDARTWRSVQLLRDCEAKRRIVEEFLARDGDADLMLSDDCLRQREWDGLRMAVRVLAAVYADHPDYRPEWRP